MTDAMARLEVWGVAEVAAHLGVSPGTVAVWRHRGHLPPPDATASNVPLWRPSTIRRWEERGGKARATAAR